MIPQSTMRQAPGGDPIQFSTHDIKSEALEKRLTSIEATQRALLMQVADLQIDNTERLIKIERRLRELEAGLAMMAAAVAGRAK
jgi:hypothetical protein